jgi:hypothetical protein
MSFAPPNNAGAGTTTVIAGSICGSQIGEARAAGNSGSTGKTEAPARHRSRWNLHPIVCRNLMKIASVGRIAPQKLPGKFCGRDIVHECIVCRGSPVGCGCHRNTMIRKMSTELPVENK